MRVQQQDIKDPIYLLVCPVNDYQYHYRKKILFIGNFVEVYEYPERIEYGISEYG